jgi:hypothetical protein
MPDNTLVTDLVAVLPAARDIGWLKRALQLAARLEFATIPPYLCAMWSIKSGDGDAYDLIEEVVIEEMLHLGLVCNMLTSLGETPALGPDAAPTYPCPLPGGFRPKLKLVTLGKLTQDRVRDVFMQIEHPHHDLVDPNDPDLPPEDITIGTFYDLIANAIKNLPEAPNPFTGARQITASMIRIDPDLTAVKSKQDALAAVELIKEQGEGTTASPRDPTIDPGGGVDDLAHFYRFTELSAGKRINPETGKFKDPPVTIKWPEETELRPMEDVPPDGWAGSAAEADLAKFDAKYSDMLKNLHAAWATDNPTPGHPHPSYTAAVKAMNAMKPLAIALMEKEMSPGKTYGPRFRAVL